MLARASAALHHYDRGRATSLNLMEVLLAAAGPRLLVEAVDLGAPFLVDATLAGLWQVWGVGVGVGGIILQLYCIASLAL